MPGTVYRTPRRAFAALLSLAALVPLPPAHAAEVAPALAAIKNVSREGQGNEAAAAAWKRLVGAGAEALIPTLEAMKGADPTASNWLRTAVDALAEAEKSAGRPLPADKLTAFVKDTAQNPNARRIGYELLLTQDPKAAEQLLAGFVDDPSLELRRDAIAMGMKQAETPGEGSQPTAVQRYRRLFASARDKDQVEEIAKALDKLKDKVSVTGHFGYVTHWQLIGPFDSTDGKGFGAAYPPETKVELKAKLKGKADADVVWVPYATSDRYATVDLNKGLGKHKEAAAYAFAVIGAEKEQPVEVRIASQNAVQIFLNGKKLFQREEYHHGTRMDQHVGRGVLKAGNNELLVKVCQNNQDQSWAQVWGFQGRLCDFTGGALDVKQMVPANNGFTPRPLGDTPAPVAEPKEKK